MTQYQNMQAESPMGVIQKALAGHVVNGVRLGLAVKQVESNLKKVRRFGGEYANITLSEDILALIAEVKYSRKGAFV
jgi:hypothetical protein